MLPNLNTIQDLNAVQDLNTVQEQTQQPLLFFNAVGAIGGAERVLLTMLETLKRTNPTLKLVLIVGTEGHLIDAAQHLGVEVLCLPLPESVSRLGDSRLKPKGTTGAKFLQTLAAKLGFIIHAGQALPALLRYLTQVRQIIKSMQPALIHSNSIKTHLILALLGHIDAPILWHIHDFYGSRPVVATAMRWAKRSATGAIAISKSVAAEANHVLHPLPISVIYNAIDLQKFAPSPATDSNVVRIGLVATFARWKGQDIFLEAAAHIKQQSSDRAVRYYIIGSPIYKTPGSQFSLAELQAKVCELQLESVVEFLKFQTDIASVYHNLDIVVHASTQPEPFGLVIIEAMACGKPVIVAQAGGAAELFTHNHDAIGVSPGDPIALAQALIGLIDDPNRRQQLGCHARQTAIDTYGCDRIGAELAIAYAQAGYFISGATPRV
ncbi:glycosyltransferase family 4 protein [Myxacorys almedinensis]|uniref:Glycosyltransferase n=1 Tax=Myxacorys almedinensis A TaxID=2690445 RepID=A0A8J7Z148_9CYAN|nr:glycosyltransferase family 4 protein [Myxacorys almedinensis]NDJ16223.1 glycosyltransferase [Myxacorys almedinensis A]